MVPTTHAEEPSLEVLSVADDDHVHIGRPVGLGCERVGRTESFPQMFELVVVITTRLGSERTRSAVAPSCPFRPP